MHHTTAALHQARFAISLIAKYCLALSDNFRGFTLRVFPWLLPGLFLRLWPFAACPDLSIATVDESALPTLHLLLSLNFACLTSSCLY